MHLKFARREFIRLQSYKKPSLFIRRCNGIFAYLHYIMRNILSKNTYTCTTILSSHTVVAVPIYWLKMHWTNPSIYISKVFVIDVICIRWVVHFVVRLILMSHGFQQIKAIDSWIKMNLKFVFYKQKCVFNYR